MMTPQRLVMLLVAAVLTVGGAMWLSSLRELTAAEGVGDRVLPALADSLNDLTEVRIVKSGGPAVTLQRSPRGWLVGERDYPANATKLRRLLIDLSRLTIVEAKTDEPANYAQLGVGEGSGPAAQSTRVSLVKPGGSTELIVGNTAGGREVFVRLADEARVWLATPQIVAEADPRRWIDLLLLDIEASRVREVAVTPGKGAAYIAARETVEAPLALRDLPKGTAQSSDDAVLPLAGLLANVIAEDVRAATASDATPNEASTNRAAKSAGKPLLRVSTFDGMAIEVRGHEDGDARLIFIAVSTTDEANEATIAKARASGERFAGKAFEIPRYQYDALFRPLADFTSD